MVTLDGYNEQHPVPARHDRASSCGQQLHRRQPDRRPGLFGTVVASWLADGSPAGWSKSVLVHSHAAYLVSEALSRTTTNPENVSAQHLLAHDGAAERIYDDAGGLYGNLAQWRVHPALDLTAY